MDKKKLIHLSSSTLAELLRYERQSKGWSQEKVAQLLGVDAKTVSRWERNETIPSYFLQVKLNDLFGKELFDTSLQSTEGNIIKARADRIIQIRITEDPLTAYNLTTVISSFTELHTKCWLIVQGQLADLIEYTQTRNPHFEEEAHLIVTKLTYNSPALIEFPDPEGFARALQTGIDTVTQIPQRLKTTKLEIQAKELEMKLKELEAQSALADKEQARRIEEQKAELEKQMTLLELARKQLEVEKQRLEVQEKRLEVEKKRIDYTLEAAYKMIDILRPNADKETKAILAQTLLPNLLHLGTAKGLELALPSPRNDEDEETSKEE